MQFNGLIYARYTTYNSHSIIKRGYDPMITPTKQQVEVDRIQ